MAGAGSMSPFIKGEPEDHRMFMNGHLGMSTPYNNQAGFMSAGINPNNLTVNGGGPMSIQTGGFGHFNNNNSSAYSTSNSGAAIADDELLDSIDNHQDEHQGHQHEDFNNFSMGYDLNTDLAGHNGMGGMSIGHQSHLSNGFSSTPDGHPIASPFIQSNFTGEQFRHQLSQQQQQYGGTPVSYGASSHMRADMYSNPMDHGRPRITQMDRRASQTRSPMTAKSPPLNVAELNLSQSQPVSYATQPIRTNNLQSHRHQKSMSSQDWENTPNSVTSPTESLFNSSLQNPLMNPGMTSMLHHPQHPASLPAKVGNGNHVSTPNMQSQEMKRRRRRESHNLVERRRRDNINERIQELSHLVPQHRLDDEKIKKHLQNNSPLSPTLGSVGISPPHATSGLAGPGARRATAGNITTGIPVEEKDKGPNKGDILNGAVSWTRDLMWFTHLKMQQHEELVSIIESLGGHYPYTPTVDELRMQSELLDAAARNEVPNFTYSRTPGSGLRVPNHTNIKGEPLDTSSGGSAMNENSLSPEDHNIGGEATQGGLGGAGQYWSGHNSGGSGPGSIGGFKEEDEYQMDIS